MRSLGAFGVALALVFLVLQSEAGGQVPQLTCGNEGEAPCPPTIISGACDTGLALGAPRCGCLLTGLFGNCLIPRFCPTCLDFTRRRESIDGFQSSWVSWALGNQRELAQDEPLNWVMHLGTHNSFNTVSDGHLAFPNQYYSITDQLRSGARLLTLDLYQLGGETRVCHSLSEGAAEEVCSAPGNPLFTSGLSPGLRYYANAIKEIRNWMRTNTREILFINFENYVHDPAPGINRSADVLNPLSAYLGSRVLGPPMFRPAGFDADRWPTRREMLASPRRVIVFDNDGGRTGGQVFTQDAVVGSFSDAWFAKNFTPYPYCSRYPFTADAATDVFRLSDTGIRLAEGDRVVLKAIPLAGGLPSGVNEETTYYVVNSVRDSEDAWTFQVATTPGGAAVNITDDEPCRTGRTVAKTWENACGMVGKAAVASPTAYSITVEERQLGSTLFGALGEDEIAAAAACNTSFVVLDRFSHAPLTPGGPPLIDITDFGRQQAAVWSWRSGDRGQHGDCAMLQASSGRWASTACETRRPFACARPRSESGLDPLEWQDPLGDDWRVTSAVGRWDEGHTMCQAEHPGYVFGVPVNGYQNRRLRDVNGSEGDLWLNYTDREVEGRWVISRAPVVNAHPVAEAGPDQQIACKAAVRLDASQSTDRDGDALTYTWSGPFGTLTGPVVTTVLSGGEHSILLTVTDGKGGIDTDSVTVTVADTKAPSLTVSLTPKVLSAADQALVAVTAMIQAVDRCDAEAPAVELVSIALHEPGVFVADATTTADVVGAETGSDDREFQLRAATGSRSGRVYQVTYRATDQAGNVAEVKSNVLVPQPAPTAVKKD